MIEFSPWPPDDGATHTVTGRVLHASGVKAPALGNARDLWVCLPSAYDDADRTWPVLYMQDGQNLFDAAIAFGGQEWHVDETLAAEAGRADAIIVGIANTGAHRIDEYSPFRDMRLGGGLGDTYLTWLVTAVKPMIDAAFRTRPGRHSTFIGGSSMGALISLHGYLTHADVFGGVAALSPSLWFGGRAIFDVVADATFAGGRVYLDTGTREGPGQLLDIARLRDRLIEKGCVPDEDLRVVIDNGGRHSEVEWARRFPGALRFLLGVEDPASPATPTAVRPRRAAPRTKPKPR